MADASAGHRSVYRIPDTDWAEVQSGTDGRSLAIGHLHDISEGGLSVELPVSLSPGMPVAVRLSTLTSGVLHQYVVTGVVTHTEASGAGWLHGMRFTSLTPAERTALTDYLCQVEYHHRVGV